MATAQEPAEDEHMGDFPFDYNQSFNGSNHTHLSHQETETKLDESQQELYLWNHWHWFDGSDIIESELVGINVQSIC